VLAILHRLDFFRNNFQKDFHQAIIMQVGIFFFFFFYTHIGKTKNKQTKLQSRDNRINPTSKSESSRGGIGKGNAANIRIGCGPTCH
jgi:hypothetical protein